MLDSPLLSRPIPPVFLSLGSLPLRGLDYLLRVPRSLVKTKMCFQCVLRGLALSAVRPRGDFKSLHQYAAINWIPESAESVISAIDPTASTYLTTVLAQVRLLPIFPRNLNSPRAFRAVFVRFS